MKKLNELLLFYYKSVWNYSNPPKKKRTNSKVRKRLIIWEKWFSKIIQSLSNRFPNEMQNLIQTIYNHWYSIMFLYEIYIAKRNKKSFDESIKIANSKRRYRHSIEHKASQWYRKPNNMDSLTWDSPLRDGSI